MTPLPSGLIVSCQAREGNPLRGPQFMAAMARAAVAGGAVAIRAEGIEDIVAIRTAVAVPIIGLLKRGRSPSQPYITPDLDAALQVADAGADWIAIDATDRPRAGGPVEEFVPAIVAATGLRVLADVATTAEGVVAAGAGAGAVATTLSGYVAAAAGPASGSPAVLAVTTLPDLDLVSELARAIRIPIVAEGRYYTPEQVAEAVARGAHAVVVGTAITNPAAITERFARALGVHGAEDSRTRPQDRSS